MPINIKIAAGESGVTAIAFNGINVPLVGNWTNIEQQQPAQCTYTIGGAEREYHFSAGRFVNQEYYTIAEANDVLLKLTCPTPGSPDVKYRPGQPDA